VQIHAFQCHAHTAQASILPTESAAGDTWRCLSEAVSLADGDANVLEELQHRQPSGRTARRHIPDVASKALSNLGEHESVKEAMFDCEPRPHGLPELQQLVALTGGLESRGEYFLLHRGAFPNLLHDSIVHFVEENRDRQN